MRNAPPKDKQWKPGQSGNPNGRPKGARNRKTRLRELLELLPVASVVGPEEATLAAEYGLDLTDLMLLAQVRKAIAGDYHSYTKMYALTEDLLADPPFHFEA